MSAVKFQCAPYKLFEPDYHPQKPIIVGLDDRLESPETLTLRYEEAARAANGGDSRGNSSPRLLEMATYSKGQLPSMHASVGYDAARYPDAGYEQYPTQPFPTQQQADKFAQLNQQSFASNNAAVAHYIPAGPTILSCQPASGGYGTKVFVKVSSHYDLLALSSPMPVFFLQFGSEKCSAQGVSRDGQDTSGFIYTCSTDAPQFSVTGCGGNSVPLSFIVEGPSGEEFARTAIGTFQYIEELGDDITRTTKILKHEDTAPAPAVDHPSASPKTELPADAPTNTYDYPTQQSQYGSNFTQGNNDMISTYRTTSFTDPHYHRRPAAGWSTYPNTLGSTVRSPAGLDQVMAGRPSLTPLPVPTTSQSGTPQLIRTSTIANSAGNNSSYHPISMYSSKAVLKIAGKLETMAENWSQDEWDQRRRIVMFRKTQRGSTLNASFQPVAVDQRPPNSVCISCIWWAEKGDCYVTSVDTIYLLEQLVAAPNRFSVEEKNRIRRNLEGFHPQTVSKGKQESEEFFKIIMAFPNPKPRNIEKDVKVFPWKILESALKKIIGKYSASPSSTLPPASMMNPGNSPYGPPPTPPSQSMTVHGDPHTQYNLPQHHDAIPSPRSLSGSQPSWTPYAAGPGYSTTASRTLSPHIRNQSPQQAHAPLRINTTPLPGVSATYDRASATGGYGGLHTPLSHHHPAATTPRWDPTSASYPDNYPSLTTQTAQPVYTTGGYSDNAPRA